MIDEFIESCGWVCFVGWVVAFLGFAVFLGYAAGWGLYLLLGVIRAGLWG